MKKLQRFFTLLMFAVPFTTVHADNSRDVAQEEKNRTLVIDFYNQFFNEHNIESAAIVADHYIQHNPYVPDGKAPFVEYFQGFFAENPQYRNKIIRSAANDDLVWLHVHSTNGENDRGEAIIDIFRIENGLIIEHWDVIQSVPAESANKNTMF